MGVAEGEHLDVLIGTGIGTSTPWPGDRASLMAMRVPSPGQKYELKRTTSTSGCLHFAPCDSDPSAGPMCWQLVGPCQLSPRNRATYR